MTATQHTDNTDTVTIDALGIADGDFVVHAPKAWHDRIRALEPFVRFGPDFTPLAWEHLCDMDRFCRWGCAVVAYDHLGAAERHVARRARQRRQRGRA